MRNEIDEGSDEKMHWLNVLFDVVVSYFLVLFQKRIIALCMAIVTKLFYVENWIYMNQMYFVQFIPLYIYFLANFKAILSKTANETFCLHKNA